MARRDPNFNYLPREATFLDPVVRNSSGGLRPPIWGPSDKIIIHHTGGGKWLDLGDYQAELRSIQEWASSVNKPWEYNFAAPGDPNVGMGYAEEFMAAHCAGWNGDVPGIICMYNGVLEDPNDAFIKNIYQLRFIAVDLGVCTPDHTPMPHRVAPCGQATGTICPMDLAEEPWWSRIAEPLDFSPLPPATEFDPWDEKWGKMPELGSKKPNIHRGDRNEFAEYAKAVMGLKLPTFCDWYRAIDLQKAKIATKPRWVKWHADRAQLMLDAKIACLELQDHQDNVYGNTVEEAVECVKMAFENRILSGHRYDFAGGGSDLGDEVWRLLDDASDGQAD